MCVNMCGMFVKFVCVCLYVCAVCICVQSEILLTQSTYTHESSAASFPEEPTPGAEVGGQPCSLTCSTVHLHSHLPHSGFRLIIISTDFKYSKCTISNTVNVKFVRTESVMKKIMQDIKSSSFIPSSRLWHR